MSKYTLAYTYVKKGNLLEFLSTDKVCYEKFGGNPSEQAKTHYAQEREIQLIALFRFELGDRNHAPKTFCRIKCPVNPLPIKGEFEVPCVSALENFLEGEGWKYKYKTSARMFE